jgi:phage gp46-like protein
MSSSAQFYLPSSSASAGGSLDIARKVRRWIDPTTRDYVVEVGELKQDYGFTSKVVLALSTKLGSCLVLPAFGSRIHEVKRADEQGRRLAEKHATNALQHLTTEIVGLSVVASISSDRPGVIEISVSGKRGQIDLGTKYTAIV